MDEGKVRRRKWRVEWGAGEWEGVCGGPRGEPRVTAQLCLCPPAGSFLVPYIIMLVVEGMPLLYLELAVGQRMRQGSIGAWRTVSPYLSGVGKWAPLSPLWNREVGFPW